LPFIKANEESRQIIEPVIVGVFAPNDNNKTNRIPNLDSENAFLDDVNVLDIDRYSGYDLNDTGSRVSYGFNWNSYGNILGRTQAFFAQSYYFDDENSFSQSLGERNHFSDYVGRIYANPSSYLDLNYRFRLDKNDWEIKYNELGARIGPDILNFYVSYIHLNEGNNAVLKNGLKSERHELYTAVNAKLTRDWSIKLYNRQDLAAEHSYSIEHGGSLTYEDECFMLSGNIQKYDSNDPEVDNDYEFTVSFFLKTIGGFGK
jgi:LPS-assembly protein